ncbi:MAG TPA: CPBP family intramembrane glutamic endopeptidase [Stellaceae bacterium]|nr:CPBP family intramembrane glutamic endopeptidase [Stellaceae bacterium]
MEDAAETFAYIDLARRGRTGFWVAVRGIIRMALYLVAMLAIAFGALVLAVRRFPELAPVLTQLPTGKAGPIAEFALIIPQVIVVLWAVHDATVRTQRRPFLSLISADGRIDPWRVLAGAIAAIVAMLGSGLVIDLGARILGFPDDSSQPPSWHTPDAQWLIAAVLGLAIIPLQAGGEELLFRGWLTQTLGQGVRNRVLLALIVGLLFALAHPPYSPAGIGYFASLSLGFSAVSLADGRLELAIGAHTAQNLFVLLVVTPFLEGNSPTLLGSRQAELGVIAAATGIIQSLLLYALTRSPAFRRAFGLTEG